MNHPPAEIGMPLADVDTPALIIDLDAFERNLEAMARNVSAAGVRIRPHAKTHKCAVIARRQMALGAVGVCCQKVSEAQALVQAGVTDVLVSNQVVGRRKIERLAALAREAKVGVCVDDAGNAAEVGEAAVAAGVTIDALVEIDVGAGRCGIAPGPEAFALAQCVASIDGLRFAGLQAYHGSAQHIRNYTARGEAIDAAASMARTTVESLAQAGIECETVAGAGTGTWQFEAASGVYNELQAGSYIFMDADYAANRDEARRSLHRLRACAVRLRDGDEPAGARTRGARRRIEGGRHGLRHAPTGRHRIGGGAQGIRRARGGGPDRFECKRRHRRQGASHPRTLRPDREPV